MLPNWQVLLTLGLLLAAALMAGGVAGFLRLPKVTAYLLVGMLLGPSVLDWIPPDHVELMEPLTNLAIALVMFNLGCHFPITRVRRIIHRVARLSVGELSATFLLVGGGLALLGESLPAAILLGALALATAPATTILVLKESESEGPVTEYTGALVALNNLASVVAFEVLFVAIHFLQGKLDVPAVVQLGQLAGDLAGSALLGVAGGLIVGLSHALVDESRRLVLLVATVTALLGACQWLEVPYLVTFLAMGITLANASYHARHVTQELDRLTGLLCVVFFVTHGAELNLAAIGQAGLIGAGYILFRFAGKYIGIWLALRGGHEEPQVRRWLGTTLMSQAGAAIALSAIAAQRDPELGRHLQVIILGTVVVFEIVGPLLIRYAVLRTGEVPLVHAVQHSDTGLADELRNALNRILLAFGCEPWRQRSTEDLKVREIMRRNIKPLPLSATFNEIISHIEHTHDNTLPVIDANGQIVGVIRYRELSNALFDPELGALVRAADLTAPTSRILHADEPVARACEMFGSSKDDCIPVVAREKPHRLLGVVRRRDIFRWLVRRQASNAQNSSP